MGSESAFGFPKDGDEGYGVVSIRDLTSEELGDYEKEFEFEKKLWESI